MEKSADYKEGFQKGYEYGLKVAQSLLNGFIDYADPSNRDEAMEILRCPDIAEEE